EHQENLSIQAEYEGSEYRGIPCINATASIDETSGRIWISACNVNPVETVDVLIEVNGVEEVVVTSSRMLASPEITACNTLENPENVKIKEFREIKEIKNTITFSFPPGSVITIGIN
ncbi:MAG: alpha-L-arabinofuranosidase C-terminal domain-containing protein, partial [Clostridia bacterium]